MARGSCPEQHPEASLMTTRYIPQHRMGPVDMFGRCTLVVNPGTCNKYGARPAKICNLPASASCHRFYPCRQGCGPDVDFTSCEMRDRHEADEHGDGW